MSATVVLKNAWVHMASDQPKTHLDFEDIDGDHWRIRWYSTLDDDSERHYFFAIEGLKTLITLNYKTRAFAHTNPLVNCRSGC
jgi:hypothetical protein